MAWQSQFAARIFFPVHDLDSLGQHDASSMRANDHLVLLKSVDPRCCMIRHHDGYVEGRTDALRITSDPSTEVPQWLKKVNASKTGGMEFSCRLRPRSPCVPARSRRGGEGRGGVAGERERG